MSDLAIRVDNLSKQYRIGRLQHYQCTFKEMVSAKTKIFCSKAGSLFRGKPNIETKFNDSIWALKNVSFDVKKEEVFGIIGHNGAGKTTLLRILSRITRPTGGHAKIYGKIGSLLDVGTGFHPELTGRENIFLSGSILGMKRIEINHKLDEIVAFSEIDKFIDTPVKHYSIGMFAKLAFSVAAHLEPDILIIDEVLAVGDISFQKKCIERMRNYASSGKTVLFVSHNMETVLSLCKKCILLEKGKLVENGDTVRVVHRYLLKSFLR